MPTSIEIRVEIEKRIARKALETMIGAGYYVRVHDGEEWACSITQNIDQALSAMMATDEDRVFVLRHNTAGEGFGKKYQQVGWVHFVYGNDGFDVICNYSTNLEAHMAGVMAFAESQERRNG